jgi:carboxylesterase
MVPLAEALAEDGLTVHIARLAGHGTSPEDLASTSWQDWIASAQRAYEVLAGRCRTIAVGGLSMGGSLALHLAATAAAGAAATGLTSGPAAVIAMATPVRLRPLVHRLARAAHPLVPFAPVLRRVGPRAADVMQYRASYPRIPLGAIGDLSRLLDRTRELLPSVRAPLLVAQGRWDWVIPGESADVIYNRVASSVRRVVWLPHSSHLVTLDRDRAILFDEVRGFLREHLRAA